LAASVLDGDVTVKDAQANKDAEPENIGTG